MGMDKEIFIVVCSPAGSTMRVAEAIKDVFEKRRATVNMLDLGQNPDPSPFMERIAAAGENACLFIGSPVYRDMAVPPVVRFLSDLPETNGAFFVPFATWGQACSGVALWQMGGLAREKGFRIAGAAKVVALHSMMWMSDDPAGKGRPDDTDFSRVREMAETLYDRFASGDVPELSLDALDYQPAEPAGDFKEKLSAPWMIIPKNVNADACTQCGICVDECPIGAVTLDPLPVFNQDCYDCFNCIRLCPEDAIEPAVPMAQIENMIKERVRTINEQPLTQIFL